MKETKSMIVAGIMSGTSADGIDVALLRIAPRPALRGEKPKLTFLAHRAFAFPRALRSAILAAMNAPNISTAELARLNWRLGIAYAEALRDTIAATKIRPALVGCHGQTLYHQAASTRYAGRRFACTWQLGEPALIAAECGIPVVSNFRPADMAYDGQGAPLVPFFDYVQFAHPTRARVLQNLGGIGNLTVISAAAPPTKVIAFDTGPGNMIIDALMQQLFSKPYDRNGRIASQGKILEPVLRIALKKKFFRQPPPKSAGREQFGAEFTARFLAACQKLSSDPADAIATATAFTSASIQHAIEQWVLPLTGKSPIDVIVSGGGARNVTLLAQLREHLAPLNAAVTTTDATGFPAEAKEAVAFALLAYQTWHHRPGNVPSATGATQPTILGQVTYV
ncbi:MAG TPA: anhydro-N-acetylmuramic acid kinase [Acidobacteriaceae bacterium]|jgi:anhydro-N-acetylmuramic acid kinase|nr:anhydro-N-acetylmuramic acid kinase [Acidobacteriaceae bacterium]